MSWLVDNANTVYVLLGIVALGFVTAWWMNKRVVFLAWAGGFVVLMVLFWLLTRVVVTDRQQIEHTVVAMANAVVEKKPQEVLKHVSRDFQYKQMKREELAALINTSVDRWKINEVKIWDFDVIELSRPQRSAKVRFKASVFASELDRPVVVLCVGDFALEDDEWKMRTIDFRDAINPDRAMPGAP
jgi:hypothetical protein